MKALRNHHYRARIEVGIFKRALCNEGVILDKLVDAGFDQITVRKYGAGKYEAEAVWLHPDSEDVELPDEITHVEDLGP